MTVAAFVQTPPYTISGVGPYEIAHPYKEGAVVAYVLIDGEPVALDMDQVTVTPEGSTALGNLYLSEDLAAEHAGRTLWIDRHTTPVQGWEARYGEREVGMEGQLDRDTMALQELRSMVGATLRGRSSMEAYSPEAGRVPIVRDDGLGWTNGPTVDEIAAAGENAEIAADAAERAEEAAKALEQIQLVAVVPFRTDNVTTDFDLGVVPISAINVLVSVNGTLQDTGAYTVVGSTLHFLTAPPGGTGEARVFGGASVNAGNAATRAEEAAEQAAQSEERAAGYEASAKDYAIGRVRWFAERAAAVAAAVEESWEAGAQITAGGLIWQFDGVSTAIPDMAGWLPAGDVSPPHFGIATGVDQTAQIAKMLDFATANGRKVRWGSGTYLFESYAFSGAAPVVDWDLRPDTILRSSKAAADTSSFDADYFIKFSANTLASGDASLTTDILAGATRITLPAAAVAVAVPGSTLLHLQSGRVIETDDRGQARVGVTVPISAVIDSTTVEIARPIPMTMRGTPLTAGAAISAVDAAAGTITVPSLIGTAVSEARYRIYFDTVGGVASSAVALPSEFDPETGKFTLIAGYPSGLTTADTITISRGISYFVTGAVRAKITGGRIDRAQPVTNAAAGDYSFRGLWIARGLAPEVRNLTIANFPEAGLRIDTCYAPQVSGVDVYNANRAYAVSDGTGYGVTVYQSGYGKFDNIRGFGCRRTLDFGGTQSVSWHNRATDIEGYGGGTAYDGVSFWPNGATNNSVVGSHGAGYGTVYRNSRGADVWCVVNLRGKSETVEGVYGAGRIETLVNTFDGDGLNLDGAYYTDERPDWAANPLLTSKSSRHGYLNIGVTIQGSVQPNRTHVIRNMTLDGVRMCAVSLSDGPKIGWLILGGQQNYVTHNELGDLNSFWVVRHSGTADPTVSGGVDLGRPTIQNRPNAPKTLFYLAQVDRLGLADGAPVKWPDGSVRFYLSDDSVASFPVHGTGCGILDLHCPVAGRPQMCADIYLSTTGRQYTYIGASSGIDFLSAIPTGTTGTDGNVSVAYQTAGSLTRLYVENRRGSRDLFALKFSELAV